MKRKKNYTEFDGTFWSSSPPLPAPHPEKKREKERIREIFSVIFLFFFRFAKKFMHVSWFHGFFPFGVGDLATLEIETNIFSLPPLWMIFTIFYYHNLGLSLLYIYTSLSNQFNSPIIITNNTNNVDRYLVIWSRFISLLPRCFDRNTFERIVVESGMARNRSQANKSSSFRDFVTAVATGRKFKQLFTFPIHEFRMARFV